MTEIEPYEFQGRVIRTVAIDGVAWFVARDVADVLEIQNVRQVLPSLDPRDVSRAYTTDSYGREQETGVVNESGLYDLAFRSRKPQARAFKRWVTEIVLPAIRETGRYESAAAPSSDSLAVMPSHAEALRGWAAELERADVAEARAVEAEQRAVALEPAAHSWGVLGAEGQDYSLRQAAMILNRDPYISTGQNRLMRQVRELRMVDGRDMPYAAHSNRLALKPQTRPDWAKGASSRRNADPQLRVTVDGLAYLHRKLGGAVNVHRHIAAHRMEFPGWPAA